jgi:hypothetical protein
VTAYDGVDFSDLQVGFWSDPEAPALVDDYVFNPAHLHQALIALDDPLPHNTWLAGERGTGKTEFVTQLAARLKRKLVRVNFDEALERADFIGANTISGGDVVWAEGIITKAIQHPGALDPLGRGRVCQSAVHQRPPRPDRAFGAPCFDHRRDRGKNPGGLSRRILCRRQFEWAW